MLLTIFLNFFVIFMFIFGIISLTIIMRGWFGHMTASGNEDKADIAKNKMIAGAICLAVVMALFTVGNYYIKNAGTAMADSNENFDRIFTTNVE